MQQASTTWWVGGLAVNAHGYLRFTKDVDLVVRLARADILLASRALEEIDDQPAVPISAEQFAHPALREQWRKEKGRLVIEILERSTSGNATRHIHLRAIRFCAGRDKSAAAHHGRRSGSRIREHPTLLAMKREAGRAQDLIDIEKLEIIAEICSDES